MITLTGVLTSSLHASDFHFVVIIAVSHDCAQGDFGHKLTMSNDEQTPPIESPKTKRLVRDRILTFATFRGQR